MTNSKTTYEQRLCSEIQSFKDVKNVHRLPPIQNYWARNYVRPKFLDFDINNIQDFFVTEITRTWLKSDQDSFTIIALGAGNCDSEIQLAHLLKNRGVKIKQFICVELNPSMIERGIFAASTAGLKELFIFKEADLNNWSCHYQSADVIIAIQSLHHIVELERLFDQIALALRPLGIFIINETVGRNGHMRWPEALELIEGLWAGIPNKYKIDRRNGKIEETFQNIDFSRTSFEGIRSQDIMPLLLKHFHFDFFLGYSNIIQPFVGRRFGWNFNVDSETDRCLIDLIAKMDEHYIDIGKIKPTQITASLNCSHVDKTRYWRGRTPRHCLRIP